MDIKGNFVFRKILKIYGNKKLRGECTENRALSNEHVDGKIKRFVDKIKQFKIRCLAFIYWNMNLDDKYISFLFFDVIQEVRYILFSHINYHAL